MNVSIFRPLFGLCYFHWSCWPFQFTNKHLFQAEIALHFIGICFCCWHDIKMFSVQIYQRPLRFCKTIPSATRILFHQHFRSNFCTCKSQKPNKTLITWLSFCALGSALVKAVCKHVVEIKPKPQYLINRHTQTPTQAHFLEK